jgi:hypothetical protein
MALSKVITRLLSRARGAKRGQATVELVICAPVLLALAVVTVDLMVFLGDCAQFNRVSAESVRVVAAAPGEGAYGDAGCEQAICEQIRADMGGVERLSFEVTSSDVSSTFDSSQVSTSLLSMTPGLRRYICTMRFVPWPLQRGLFGIEVSGIDHRRTYVLDPYRPGVVV